MTPRPWPRLRAIGDYDGNGTTEFADYKVGVLNHWAAVVGDANYYAAGDGDMNGQNAFADYTVILNHWVEKDAIDSISRSGQVIGFTGALWDPDVGLCLMRKRWYDPHLGRWMQRDPAGYVDGMSLYLYVSGNPLISYDPFGLSYWSDFAEGARFLRHVGSRIGNNLYG